VQRAGLGEKTREHFVRTHCEVNLDYVLRIEAGS